MFRAIQQVLTVDTSNPALIRAQITAFSRQVPLIYFLLAVNVIAIAYVHYGVAPAALTIYFPGVLTTLCLARLVMWLRYGALDIAEQKIGRVLRMTGPIGSLVASIFVAWSISLYRYGDVTTHGNVTFFVAITALSCIFCLMHLRAAAVAVAITVVPAFAFFLFMQGSRGEIAISLNMLLVSATMVYMLLRSSHDFDRLINSQAEMSRLSGENSRLANIDSLTSLPNRRMFLHELGLLTAPPRDSGMPFVVGVIDLDGFKPVNDLHGHAAGDRVLQEIGARLGARSDARTFIARLGGDEFGVILRGITSKHEILQVGEDLCEVLREQIALPETTVRLSGSIGLAIAPESGGGNLPLYERADYALYHAKNHKRGHPVLFSEALETEIRSHGKIEQALRNADLDVEMTLHFQPLYDTAEDRVTAFEALARWHSPELGAVSPASFIPVAERSDQIHVLTRTLLKKALSAALDWPESVGVSFNLSARDLVSEEAILHLIVIVEQSGIDPRRIDFEITETSLMSDFDRASNALRALKALGANISLDDFGTGYSSLSYVHRLPLDKIKIDRSFVEDVNSHSSSRDIVRTVVALCRSLHLDCVVEGIETDEQARALRHLGCRTMQGYFFGEPMPAADARAYLTRVQSHRRDRPFAAMIAGGLP